MKILPTVFHITHAKAGSQWVAEILKQSAPDRCILPQIEIAHFLQAPIKTGGIYPAVYISKANFDAAIGSAKWSDWRSRQYFFQHPIIFTLNWFHFRIQKKPLRVFVVIRDLRDTLISLYFSLKISHPQQRAEHITWRNILATVDKEEGLLLLLHEKLLEAANKQVSWVTSPDTFLMKYEELVADEYSAFQQIFTYCQIQIDPQKIQEIIYSNSFENMTGRKRGQEDRTAHQRKGVVGDWRNHFTGQVKEEFKQRFGDVLIKTGYERGLNW